MNEKFFTYESAIYVFMFDTSASLRNYLKIKNGALASNIRVIIRIFKKGFRTLVEIKS